MRTGNMTFTLSIASILIIGGLACRRPAPTPPPPSKALASAPPNADDNLEDGGRKAEADAKRKAEEDLEASRLAAAARDSDYRKAGASALQDVHFNLDKADLMERDKATLGSIAQFMRAYPQAQLAIDGDCDERGTVEYNLALGDLRSHAVVTYLTTLGVMPARLSATSYGKEKPVCTASEESCWSRNRRAHFTLQ